MAKGTSAKVPAKIPEKVPEKAKPSAILTLWRNYLDTTPSNLKVIDSFLAFIMLSGIIQFAYCVLVTAFPYNAFLAAFASTIGQFVLTASLRSQVNPSNRSHFNTISSQRAFADFTVGSIVLHFFVFNFLG
ncbi:DAD/Ost2 [Cantharellus anzutake]|uniref:DAD/Ost2 n=1 Tax=Cantharellus anzutake TaxID=1750568 RepID=UPI001902C914|nr:DAD/Ost2 [Cantharellus anzutake]KAF8342338.1 DAD/Ost2 [Cantharellus anzutake]